MPRQARIDAAGALHHIICRGIERWRYLGLTATAVGQDLGLSKSAVSRAAEKGRCLAKEMSLAIEE